MLQRTKEEYRLWLKGADYKDKDYQKIVQEMKDDELHFFYGTYMTLTRQANEQFIDFVKKYKEIY